MSLVPHKLRMCVVLRASSLVHFNYKQGGQEGMHRSPARVHNVNHKKARDKDQPEFVSDCRGGGEGKAYIRALIERLLIIPIR